MVAKSTVIIEENAVLRDGLKLLLEVQKYDVRVAVSNVGSLGELGDLPPNSLVILSWTHGTSVMETIKAIRASIADPQIIVLTRRNDMDTALDAIRGGASACLDASTSPEIFFKSLDLASCGLAAISLPTNPYQTSTAQTVAPAAAPRLHRGIEAPATISSTVGSDKDVGACPSFSLRETAVLQQLREGASNKLIARNLSLTEGTVKVHLKSILRKIRVQNRTQAAVWAMSQESFDVGVCPMQDGAVDGIEGWMSARTSMTPDNPTVPQVRIA